MSTQREQLQLELGIIKVNLREAIKVRRYLGSLEQRGAVLERYVDQCAHVQYLAKRYIQTVAKIRRMQEA